MTDISDNLDFQKKIEKFSPEGKFLAEQIYDIQQNCPACNGNTTNKKQLAGISGISGLIGAALLFLLEWGYSKITKG